MARYWIFRERFCQQCVSCCGGNQPATVCARDAPERKDSKDRTLPLAKAKRLLKEQKMKVKAGEGRRWSASEMRTDC